MSAGCSLQVVDRDTSSQHLAASNTPKLHYSSTPTFQHSSTARSLLEHHPQREPQVQRFDYHIFICTNVRPPDNPKGCCSAKGSEAIAEKFKEELHRRGLKGKVRANKAGCLDACERGPSIVIYPDGVWYQRVTLDDVVEIIESHILGGKPVERLRVPATQWRRPVKT